MILRGEAVSWVIEKVNPWLAKIGSAPTEITDLMLEPVLTPTIGASGETIDTTAIDPSSQVQGATAEGASVDGSPLGTPQIEQPAPDMVIGPITIPAEGYRVQTSENPEHGPIAADGAGEVMTLGSIDVGSVDGTEAAPLGSTTPSPSAVLPTELPVRVYALASGDMRVTLFAESPGGWDGLRIERVVAVPPAPVAPAKTRGRGMR